jgi:hypothetical protein
LGPVGDFIFNLLTLLEYDISKSGNGLCKELFLLLTNPISPVFRNSVSTCAEKILFLELL